MFQNWRHDVVMVLKPNAEQVEQTRYSSYGVPFGLPAADANSNGMVDAADLTLIYNMYSGTYGVLGDINLNGMIDVTDLTLAYNLSAAGHSLGRGVLSRSDVGLRRGYAGYEWDPAVSRYHVRNRVYAPELGRWTNRDPLLNFHRSNSSYEYSSNSPVSRLDSLGLFDDPLIDRPTRPPSTQDTYRCWKTENCQPLDGISGKRIDSTNGLSMVANDVASRHCMYADIQCHARGGSPDISDGSAYPTRGTLREIERRRGIPGWDKVDPKTDNFKHLDNTLKTIEAGTDEVHWGCCSVFAGPGGKEFKDLLERLYPGTKWSGPEVPVWTTPGVNWELYFPWEKAKTKGGDKGGGGACPPSGGEPPSVRGSELLMS
ncbi:MAG: hypothetical protein JNM80_10455 [Phycisphaerae bacterium]|nr:hypothetical protein [Phycisphaerae bacterium]